MSKNLFNITDAHNAMANLSQEQALYWAKLANVEYSRLSKVGTSEVMMQRKAMKKASEEVKAKYGHRG